MSSTNETTNYDLSQFIGTDKPAWLTDYNQDMNKIDTAIKSASDTATAADGKADANAAKIGELSSLSTSAKTNLVAAVNEVDTNADTAQATANGLVSFFNLSNISNSTVTFSDNLNGDVSRTIRSATNAEGSLGKVYGSAYFSKKGGATGPAWIKITSGLRPASQITISGFIIANGVTGLLAAETATVDTNGDITFNISDISAYDTTNHAVILPACLIFAADFGD